MSRKLIVGALLLGLVAVGCGEEAETPTTTALSQPTTSESAFPPTTHIEPTSSTTSTTQPDLPESAGFYRYGEAGLVRVVGGVEEVMFDAPVWRAWDDLMGGVVFTRDSAGDLFRITSGESTPTSIVRSSGYAYPSFTGLLDGEPSLFFAGIPEGADLSEWPCGDWSLNSRNLITEEEQFHLCLPIEDAWLNIASIGGDLFVGAPGYASGSLFTSTGIEFWDTDGNRVEMKDNPLPSRFPSDGDSCQPCELAALISPDGTKVAYWHRPDSKWPPSAEDNTPTEVWWEQSRAIPAALVVIDLESSVVEWRLDVAPDTGLDDFDGRFLAVRADRRGTETLIYDTIEGGSPPVRVEGRVAFYRSNDSILSISHSGLGIADFFETPTSVLERVSAVAWTTRLD